MIEGHISKAFDGALSSVHLRVVEMGGLVLRQVQDAVVAYADWNSATANLVLGRETAVNRLEQAIEEEAVVIIARRQPMASDLRLVMAIERVITNLERAGDEAKKVARLVVAGGGRSPALPGAAVARDIRQMGKVANDMMRASLEAFDTLDANAAAEVVRRDLELDAEYASGLRRLLTRAMEDPHKLQSVVESAFVLKSVERMGDHARNIARQVIQLVGGVQSTRNVAN
ncbi:MAG: phosphate signaling complex protein PhoU [Pseudomonadota bacterium]